MVVFVGVSRLRTEDLPNRLSTTEAAEACRLLAQWEAVDLQH